MTSPGTAWIEMASNEEGISGNILNWDEALKRMRGYEDQLPELVGLFLEECPNMMAAVRDAVNSHDAEKTLQRAAHTLKGSADIFAAERVVETAWQIGANRPRRRFDRGPGNPCKAGTRNRSLVGIPPKTCPEHERFGPGPS